MTWQSTDGLVTRQPLNDALSRTPPGGVALLAASKLLLVMREAAARNAPTGCDEKSGPFVFHYTM
jgi:hypothetical protein